MAVGLTVLVIGGSGYIGSHTCVALIERGHEVVVIDDYSNSSPKSLERVRDITGCTPMAFQVDIRDRHRLADALSGLRIDAVIHFAAKKSVPESNLIPLDYFDVNVSGTVNVLRAMVQCGIQRIVYSSSCSIYGNAQPRPLTESDPPGPINPYAWTKWACEQIIEQACRFHPGLRATSLRYFNPAGAHPSGGLGDAATGSFFNVMPILAQVASGQLPEFSIYGDDYPTRDGTAIRDYIHVVDVADAHVAALDYIDGACGMQVLNIGTGVGTSVMELRNAFAAASGREIPFKMCGRRPGDPPVLIADPEKVAFEWNWRTSHSLDAMCRDAWRFHCQNLIG